MQSVMTRFQANCLGDQLLFSETCNSIGGARIIGKECGRFYQEQAVLSWLNYRLATDPQFKVLSITPEFHVNEIDGRRVVEAAMITIWWMSESPVPATDWLESIKK